MSYYTRVNGGELVGPFPDHFAALHSFAERDGLRPASAVAGADGAVSFPPVDRVEILVNLAELIGNVPSHDTARIDRLLDVDPVLRRIFNYGRRVGYGQGKRDAAEELAGG